MRIVPVTKENFEEILPLIAKYQVFYKAVPDTEHNRKFFSQFIDDHSRGVQFIACDDDNRAVGFITLYFTFSSVSASPICILNDLYVDASYKQDTIRSAGNKLIAHGFYYAVRNGYKKVSGTTDYDNFTAQRLYNSIVARYPIYKVEKTVKIEYCGTYDK
jgi:ribosomal protein S18 acetylase RimI-like enzyme